MPTFDIPAYSQVQDQDDMVRRLALSFQANETADMVDPADVYGDEEWSQRMLADPTGGKAALGNFENEWNWGMTPAQRAKALADTAFRREMDALVDASVGEAVRPRVDPVEYARQVAARRNGRL